MGAATTYRLPTLFALLCLGCVALQYATAENSQNLQSARNELLLEARHNFDFITPPLRPNDSAWKSELLVEAVIHVESSGAPRRVGAHGERGLMQLKRTTWDYMSAQVFGAQIPFDLAFDPDLNRLLGRAYLAYLSGYLAQFRDFWQADERTLLLACYNYGPTRVKAAGFNPARLPDVVVDYADRISALHDDLLLRSTAPAEMAMIETDTHMLFALSGK